METFLIPDGLDRDSVSKFLQLPKIKKQIGAMLQRNKDGIRVLLRNPEPLDALHAWRAAFPHMHTLLDAPGELISTRNPPHRNEHVDVPSLLETAGFSRFLEHIARTYGHWDYLRNYIGESEWARHLNKMETAKNKADSAAKYQQLINGACAELLLEIIAKFISHCGNAAASDSIRLLDGRRGHCIPNRESIYGMRLKAGRYIHFTSKYNCELKHHDKTLTELDTVLRVKHGGKRAVYLLDATTAPDASREKLTRDVLFSHHLDSREDGTEIDLVSVHFQEALHAEKERERNVCKVHLPLWDEVSRLKKATFSPDGKPNGYLSFLQKM